jgi:hypothetical protein
MHLKVPKTHPDEDERENDDIKIIINVYWA